MSEKGTSSDQPRIAVVSVSYNSGESLRRFLSTVVPSSSSALTSFVVDNVPEGDPEARSIVEAARSRYLWFGKNLGYGAAINAAVAKLPPHYEWILVSNPDVELREGSLDVLVTDGDADPSVGCVGPTILTSHGEVYPSARSVPSLRTGVGHALFAGVWPANPWTRRYKQDGGTYQVARDAGWLSGACILIRRSVFDEVGGFDDGYFMYFEDVDLGFRVGGAGYRNVFEPRAVVVHSGAHSTSGDSRRMIRAHHDSARRFVNRKYRGPLLWPIRLVLGLGLRLRSAIVQRIPAR